MCTCIGFNSPVQLFFFWPIRVSLQIPSSLFKTFWLKIINIPYQIEWIRPHLLLQCFQLTSQFCNFWLVIYGIFCVVIVIVVLVAILVLLHASVLQDKEIIFHYLSSLTFWLVPCVHILFLLLYNNSIHAGVIPRWQGENIQLALVKSFKCKGALQKPHF